MVVEEKYMARCIELARGGEGNTAPNPMVIDHMSLIILIVAFLIPSVRHMYMPVDKKSRVILVHQSVEDLKSLVWEIQTIV